MRSTVGGTRSSPPSGRAATTAAIASARQVLLSATVQLVSSMSSRWDASSLPSAIVTAAPTQMSATSVAAETAAKMATQTIGSSGSRTITKPSTTNSATQVPSVNWARLKNALKVGISRSNARAADEPTSPAITSSCAGRKRRPATSGSSPSDSECVLRRKCRCTTQRSAAANPSATSHHGTSSVEGPAPSGATSVR
jgi:hypothetical protein